MIEFERKPAVDGIIRFDDKNEVIVKVCGHDFLLTRKDFEDSGICEGDLLTDAKLEELENAEQRLKCIKKAFDFLSYGDMSEKKLKEKLCAKFDKELAADVARLFVKHGYINDEELAQRYAEDFYEYRKYGPIRIKDELYKRGFNSETTASVVEKYECADHRENILYLIEKKFPDFDSRDSAQRKKAYAYLYRCGYPASDISGAFDGEEY